METPFTSIQVANTAHTQAVTVTADDDAEGCFTLRQASEDAERGDDVILLTVEQLDAIVQAVRMLNVGDTEPTWPPRS